MTSKLLEELQSSLWLDLRAFYPELLLCGAIVLLLVVRLFKHFDRVHLGWISLVVSLAALWGSWLQWSQVPDFDPRNGTVSRELFAGLLVFDNFAIYLKMFLYVFTSLVVLLTLMTGIPDKEDSADFHVLLLGAVVGMSVMASANHLLTVFMGIEMASLPSYALVGFLKGRRQSSEASLKYVVYGGGAAGVMLYGISLLAGRFGTGYLPDLVRYVAASNIADPVLLMGLLFLLVGIAFKLSAVPFHFWCPDVFEGASAEVGAFLSVASKGAALALLARVTMGLGGLTGTLANADAWLAATKYMVPILAVAAIVTTTFGNLAAYGQTNLKRLLAYSTIAHAGFMMMGLATMSRDGVGAVLFYLVIYLVMNLGAFSVVAFLRNLTGSEDLGSFRGMIHRSPVLVVTLAFFLLSLLGLPPLAGFNAKFQIFTSLFEAATLFSSRGLTVQSGFLVATLFAAGLNTVLSLFYYVKVLKVMILDKSVEQVEGQAPAAIDLPVVHTAYLSILAGVILVLGVLWNPLAQASSGPAVDCFHAAPATAIPPIQAARGGD